jgi:hypothetical protein
VKRLSAEALQHAAVLFGVVALLAATAVISGCASFQAAGREMLPVLEAEPIEQNTSNYAEGGFLVLDTIDTLQTVQIAKHPECFREADPLAAKMYGTDHPSVGEVMGVNVALMLVHTMAAAWLDDEVAKHDAANDGSVGPWYIGRVVFHAVSIIGSGAAVASNYHIGLTPFGINKCDTPTGRPVAPPTTVLLHGAH